MSKLNPTRKEAESQRHSLCMEVLNHLDLWVWLGICPHSQCMTAFDIDRGQSLLYALPCNQWSCRHCAIRKTKALACKTEAAKPNRLVTLTVDPKLYTDPRDAFDKTRRQVPEWVKLMRLFAGEFEYLRVTEVTKKGWPHYHMLVRSPYIPHCVAKEAWEGLTGAVILDIRQVKKAFRCYTYLLKYLTKMHHIEWTGRHVSYSRGFFPKNEDPAFAPHQLEERMVHNYHPATFLHERCLGKQIRMLTPRTYQVDDLDTVLDRYREDCGENQSACHQLDMLGEETPPDMMVNPVSRADLNAELAPAGERPF